MAMATRKQNNTGRTIAVISGGALVVWLLWRGYGRGKGKGTGSGGDDRDSTPSAVEVRLRSGDRIELNGVSSDLATAVAHARAAGMARVFATGDARHGWVTQVIAALKAAGVTIDAAPSLLN
jgi:hypothetical protein